jgi:hypothetical protein
VPNGAERVVRAFRGVPLPEPARLVGYAELIEQYDLPVPTPYRLSAVVDRHHPQRNYQYTGSGTITVAWRLYSPRYAPGPDVLNQLGFALKYEGLNLGVLSSLFARVPTQEIAEAISKIPTGSYSRRVWFLYEWLTGVRLPLTDLDRGNYVSVVDSRLQFAGTGVRVPRQRVWNNLPGTPAFCPLVSRTERLDAFDESELLQRVEQTLAAVPADIISRTAAFLLLKDSRSSFAIEGESPPRSRIERWGRIIGEAGAQSLSMDELVRLQRIVLGASAFVPPGLRREGGFVGEHDRDTATPIPEHVSACPEDLPSLMEGLITMARRQEASIPAAVAATCIAFGFVYIHPLADGNGRLHRYLLHHVLAERGFGRPGLVFPISAAILDRVEEYRRVLQSYSHRLLPYVEWETTSDHNVQVTNNTAHLYRYPDLTPHAEFVAACLRRTIEEDLPRETQFLQGYESFRRGVNDLVDMPDRTIHLLYRVLSTNRGRISGRHRSSSFAALTDEQAALIEKIYAEAWSGPAGE